MPSTMERREQYDPEDIESLLQERGYDELLEEERAFVLRHLSGREEYEAMRTLLRDVRESDRNRQPIAADPELREDLLTLFRDHRQPPQWRVWLNSLGGLLMPGESKASGIWRPVLALGGLALVITAGIWIAHETGRGTNELAELQPKKESAKAAASEESIDPLVNTDTARLFAATATRNEDTEQAQGRTAVIQEGLNDAQEPLTKKLESAAISREDELAEEAVEDAEPLAAAPSAWSDSAVSANSVDAITASGAAPMSGSSHTVTATELAVNQSVANASGSVVVSPAAKALIGSSTLLASAREVIPMLATVW